MAAGPAVMHPGLRYPALMQYVDVDEFGFWKASGGPTPQGWGLLNTRVEIGNCVAEFLFHVEGNRTFGRTICGIYRSGYRYASVTKGFHQLERMTSMIQNKSENVCHITFRLRKGGWDPGDRDYKTIHLYVNQEGKLWGATLWDERTDQAIS